MVSRVLKHDCALTTENNNVPLGRIVPDDEFESVILLCFDEIERVAAFVHLRCEV